MGVCCASYRQNNYDNGRSTLQPTLQHDINKNVQYVIDIVEASDFQSNFNEKVYRRAQNNPQRLFKNTNVQGCFKHGQEHEASFSSSESQGKKSGTTVPTDLTTSDRITKWKMQ